MAKRYSQPQQSVGVDWSNPITRGLQECVTPQSLLTNVAGATKVTTLTGAGLKGDGTSSYFWRPYTGAKITTAGTIFCIVNGATASADARIFSLGSSASTIPIIALQSSGSSAIRGGAFNRAGGQDTLDSGITAFESGVPHTLASAFGGGLNKLFQDGIFRQSVATTNDFSSYTLDRVAVGCLLRSTAGSFNSSAMLLGLIWNRALSDLEIKSLSDNPWQIFQPTNRAFYPAAAGGGTGNATGSLASITIDAATGTAAGKATATAAPASVSITAPTATATGGAVGNATGSLSSVTLAGPTATATGKAQATTTPASVALVSPTATATGKGQASGALAAVSLVAPTGTASTSAGGTGNAIASPASITIAAPSATATGAAAAFAAFMSVVLTPVSGTASSGVIQVAGAVTRDRRTHSVSTSRPGRIANTTR